MDFLALGELEDFVFVDHDPWPLIFEGQAIADKLQTKKFFAFVFAQNGAGPNIFSARSVKKLGRKLDGLTHVAK